MSRPKIEGNKRSRVLYTRDAWQTLVSVLHMWSVECSLSLSTKPADAINGSAGVAVHVGQWVGKDILGRAKNFLSEDDDESNDEDWIPSTTAEVATPPSGGIMQEWSADVNFAETPELGTYQLITLDAACKWFAYEFGEAMRRFNVAMLKQTSIGKKGRFRAFCFWMRAQARSAAFLEIGISRLQAVCLTQRRRAKGPQIIQTRRPINAPYYTSFRFNGTHAIRLPQGRPALSEAEWLKRYMARKKAEKKTDVVHKDKVKEPRIRPTKNGRPSRTIELQLQTYKSAVRQYESNPAFERDAEFDSSEIVREFAQKATEEFTKQFGEAAGNKILEWMGL